MSEESEDPTVSVVGVEVFDSVFSVGEIIGESPVSIFFFGVKLTPSLKSSIESKAPSFKRANIVSGSAPSVKSINSCKESNAPS